MPSRRKFQMPDNIPEMSMSAPSKPQYLDYRQGLLKGIAHYTARRLPEEKRAEYISQVLTNPDILNLMKAKHELLQWLDDDDSVLKMALTMGTIYLNNMV